MVDTAESEKRKMKGEKMGREGRKEGERERANWLLKMKRRISDHILQMLKINYTIL